MMIFTIIILIMMIHNTNNNTHSHTTIDTDINGNQGGLRLVFVVTMYY